MRCKCAMLHRDAGFAGGNTAADDKHAAVHVCADFAQAANTPSKFALGLLCSAVLVSSSAATRPSASALALLSKSSQRKSAAPLISSGPFAFLVERLTSRCLEASEWPRERARGHHRLKSPLTNQTVRSHAQFTTLGAKRVLKSNCLSSAAAHSATPSACSIAESSRHRSRQKEKKARMRKW